MGKEVQEERGRRVLMNILDFAALLEDAIDDNYKQSGKDIRMAFEGTTYDISEIVYDSTCDMFIIKEA
jgi:hypothetical protein